jgi:hypothetical protein
VIRLLRFVGVTNAAVWFGAAVFFTLFVAPGIKSTDVQSLLGAKNFPFFGGAIGQIILSRYFKLHLLCASIALVHSIVERLYFGRSNKGMWTGLLVTMFLLSLLASFWLGPEKLTRSHNTQYSADPKITPAQRDTAAKSFRKWDSIFQVVNVFMMGGVAVVLWRVVTPSDELRFVGSGKFRG